MKTRYKVIMAVAAFLLTFLFITFFNTCIANAKEKEKTEASSSTSKEGIFKFLQHLSKKDGNLFKKMFEVWKKQIEKEKQLRKDINLTAEVIFWENWYTDKNKEAAYDTGAVAWNRVKSPKFPNTLEEVLYQKGQYSTTKYFFTQELPKECYEMAEDIVMNGTPDVPETVLFQATFKQGKVWKVINGEYFCYG